MGMRADQPTGDLGSRVEPELVQDAADVAVDGALGDEQLYANLLVGQTLGDQARHICLSFAEHAGTFFASRPRTNLTRLAQGEAYRGLSVHALAGSELGVELRTTKQRDRRLLGLVEQ